MKVIPPKKILQFLRWFCREDYIEEIEGDLTEILKKQYENSPRMAKWKFAWSVIKYFRPQFLKSLQKYHQPNSYGMYKSYFKIGWRNLTSQKMYSLIKIGGLAVGIAACLVIILFIRQELGYDRNYANGDRIFRVLRESTMRGETRMGLHFPAPFVGTLTESFPEIEMAGHYNAGTNFGAGANEVRRVDQAESTHEENFVYMDQSLLEILELTFVAGNLNYALTDPNSIVITESKAQKYFAHEDPLGKLIILNNEKDRTYKVTGVVKEFPANVHLNFEFIMTMSGKEMWPGESTEWRASNYIDYIRVKPGADVASLENKMRSLIKNYFIPATEKGNGDKMELDWLKSISFHLQPVRDIYLNKPEVSDGLRHGDARYLWLFAAIAFFILIIACINFVNLSTARSANRAKEVGLRKVVGATRVGLVNQFLVESVLVSAFSCAAGVVLAWTLLPFFNQMLGQKLIFSLLDLKFLLLIVSGTLAIGLVAGLYPSFYLSSFLPAKILKGNTRVGMSGSFLRSSLVVFQFVISGVLIVSTVVIYRQMDFIVKKKLGYDKEQVMILESTHTLANSMAAFKKELSSLPAVRSTTASSFVPVDNSKRDGGPVWKEGMDRTEGVGAQHWQVDFDYIKTLGIKIKSGRDFSYEIVSDSNAIVINESMVKALGLKDPIGKSLFSLRGERKVIGVIEDFHFESLRQKIEPMQLMIGSDQQTIMIKLNTSDIASAIESITQVWKKFSPNQAIRFTFLDQSYARMYDDVNRMGNLFGVFALLAITVACFGLFALSSFTAEQRSKEVSIRIVLGASLKNIFNLLTLNFLKLITASIFIAAPIAWYLMNKWLEAFAYRTEITWDVFALTGTLSIMIVLMTISYQSVKAAMANPIKSLRSE